MTKPHVFSKGDAPRADPPRAPLVLVVDDEPSERALLSYNLRAAGFRVQTAADGAEALKMALADPPDAILLDWTLPRLSGIEVCRQIRARACARHAAVILMSARSAPADRARGLDSGADDYVTKPYSVSDLLARVRAHLRQG